MTNSPYQPELAPAIRTILGALRQRIRRYVWLEGLGWAVAWLGFAFWASLGLDWFFEPAIAVRQAILGAAGLGLGWLLFRGVIRRAWVPLRDPSMALLLERHFPQFGDSLLTAVELAAAGAAAGDLNPDLVARTCRKAAEPVAGVRLQQVFNPRPLRLSLVAGVFWAVSVVLFGFWAPESLGVWARRSLLMAEEPWPRKTWLEVEGFEDGVTKVARGVDLEVIVKAALWTPEEAGRKPLKVPDAVEVRCRGEGRREQRLMSREGFADPQTDRYQPFSYTFRSILTPITFDVVGGDAAVRDLRIEVVDNPTITRMILDCEYPKYTGRPPQSFPVTGMMQFPQGSRITVRAAANKDLVRVQVDSALEDPPKPLRVVRPTDPRDPRTFQYTLDVLKEDTTLLCTLFDTDGIKGREPVRLTLAALEDRRPEFAVQLRGIGSAITPQAALPAAGRITDDYGIARVWFAHAVDKGKPATSPIAVLAGNVTEYALNRALDVRDLKLKPGVKLSLAVKAEDRFDLAGGPNVGTGERWLLEVVSPEQLGTMLQARELVLRQRFEAIIKEMVETRESLARVEFGASPASAGSGGPAGGKAPAKGAEPGDPSPEAADRSPERLLAQRTVQVQWAAQNSVKNAHEVLGLAEAIGAIREELVNNRIDTEELKRRLEDGIAVPLRRIGGEMFPELDRRLDRLQASLADAAAGTESRNRAVQQADAVLLAMRQVLSRMIELEDFNEAVELLRSIIQSQEKVSAETQKRHKQKLRELLEK